MNLYLKTLFLFSFLLLFLSMQIQAQPTATPQVAINEIMASNSLTQKDPTGEYDDWIEIRNNTNAGIDISNWYLSDQYSWRKKWKFPSGSIITPYGYLIIWCDSQTTQSGLHSTFKLNKGGEEVILCKVDTAVIDSITFGKQITDTTYARIPNGNGPFVYSKPTFDAPNSQGGAGLMNKERGNEISVYPNPAGGKIILRGEDILNMRIFNSSMKEVYFYNNTFEMKLIEIDISDLAKGYYIIEMVKGKNILSKTLVVN